MPSDFSRSVSHESGVFQSDLVIQKTKNTGNVSTDCDETLDSAPSVASTQSKVRVSVLASSPFDGDTPEEGLTTAVTSPSKGDISISEEPECRPADIKKVRNSSNGSSEDSPQEIIVRENQTDVALSSSSVPKVSTLSQHSGLLLISKPTLPNSEITECLNKERRILWIGRDLLISKTDTAHGGNKSESSRKSAHPLAFTDGSLTVQKIEYKCKFLQEHSKACPCDTPRLHVYLTDGHQCGGECCHTDSQHPATYIIDTHTLTAFKMTGKMKAKYRDRKPHSFRFSNNMVKVEGSSANARASIKHPQVKKKQSGTKKSEPESELLAEGECVWLPTIMSTLSGDVEYVVLDDHALNLGTSEEPISPESLKSKINNIYHDIDEKPIIESAIITLPNNKPNKMKLPPLRRLSEVNCTSSSVRRDVVQPIEISDSPKPNEVCVLDDPTSSSLAEVCTNRCPSIKDIFGDIYVKEEPVDDVKQDMTVDDFSKEILKSSGKESDTVSPVVYVQKVEAGDGCEDDDSGKGLFAKLIKEENDTNEKVNADGYSSDDSLGPLQIDEKFLPSPEDPSPPVAKEVVDLNMPSVNIISPFKIRILLGTPNRDPHQMVVNPSTAVAPPSTAIVGKIVEMGNVVTTIEKVQHPVNIGTQNSLIGDQVVKVVNPSNVVQSLTCIYCHTTCPNTQALAEHFENHQKDGLIICYFCQKSFGDKTGMKRHMRTHTGEKPYQCKICGKRFSLPGNFKKHRDIHEDKRTEPCEICGKTFRRKEHLKYHMRTHTGEKPYSCTECGTCFTARYSLQIHMNIHLGKKPYKCTFCNKAFSDKSTMRKHVRVHTGEKPFRCPECWRCFGESGTLASHMATHRNDRPFRCNKCDLRFKTSGGLRQHDKVHSGEKQFACKFCGMKFLQKYNMTMHERIHTGEKPHTCSQCQRSFRSRSCLAKHTVLHGGEDERRFGCDHCDSRFYRKAHLRRHIDMHLGIKHYECDFCKKKFCTRGTLRNHMKTFHTHGARRFPCDRCGRVFKRKIYVSTHLCANTAYKVVKKLEEINEAPSENPFNESSDTEDLTLEVKSEPEDSVMEEERVSYNIDGCEVNFDIMNKEVKLEWEAQTSV